MAKARGSSRNKPHHSAPQKLCSLVLEIGHVASRNKHLSVGYCCSSEEQLLMSIGCSIGHSFDKTRVSSWQESSWFQSLKSRLYTIGMKLIKWARNFKSPSRVSASSETLQHLDQLHQSIITPNAYPKRVFPSKCANTPPSKEKS